jgi:uncharacterized protein YggE
MRAPLFALFILLLSFTAPGETAVAQESGIVVTGIAETAYEPDYLIVVLQNRENQKLSSDRSSTARRERALTETLKGLGIDTNLLSVHRFNVSEYSSYFKVEKLGVDKTYSLRIDDLVHYEDIIMAIAKTGFDYCWISRLGLNDVAGKEAEVTTAAISSGKSKAKIIEAAWNGGKEAALLGARLSLTGIEEMPNNFRHDQNSRGDKGTNDGLSIGGGRYQAPANLNLDKIVIRKAFQMRYSLR